MQQLLLQRWCGACSFTDMFKLRRHLLYLFFFLVQPEAPLFVGKPHPLTATTTITIFHIFCDNTHLSVFLDHVLYNLTTFCMFRLYKACHRFCHGLGLRIGLAVWSILIWFHIEVNGWRLMFPLVPRRVLGCATPCTRTQWLGFFFALA